MSAGDILDQAIRIYRRNFAPLVSIVAIVSVPIAVLQVIATLISYPLSAFLPSASPAFDPNSFNTTRLVLGQAILYLIAFIAAIAAIFQSAALTVFVSERFLGRLITVRQAYARAFRRWLALLIATILIGLVFAAVFGVLFGVFFVPFLGFGLLGSGMDSGASAAMGVLSLLMCCLILPALGIVIFLTARWAFFIPAIVLENYNSTGGMGRSWKLVKGSFWRVALILFMLVILVYLFSVGPILLASFLALALASPALLAIVNSVVVTLVNIILTPLQFAALTILYYDLRIRKEGFDLQVQMLGLPDPTANPQIEPARPKPSVPAPAPAPSSQEPPLDLPPLYSRDDYPSQ